MISGEGDERKRTGGFSVIDLYVNLVCLLLAGGGGLGGGGGEGNHMGLEEPRTFHAYTKLF